MNSYNNLLKIYSKAIKLSERFKKTRLLVWTPLDILNELTLQISHLFTVLYDKYSESNRNITNMGDELSDVILQLIALSSSMNINLQKYNKEDIISSSNFDDLVVIYGQLVEAVMEINNKRFYKIRVGFKNHETYIISRITRMLSIIINYSNKNKIDLNKEFDLMCIDANNFLDKFRNKNLSKEEYVDIYDSKENYIGILNKKELNTSNNYSKTFNCFFINPYKGTIYLQAKNHNHNKIFSHDTFEFTVGGHLVANETLKACAVRESREETGINLKKQNLVYYKKRKQNLFLNKNYSIKEFQYFYIYVDNIALENLRPDKVESKYFIEVKIKDLMSLIKKRKKAIIGRRILKSGRVYKRTITLNDFNIKFFVEDKIVINMLKFAKENCLSALEKLKEKIYLNKLIYKYNKLLMLDKSYEKYIVEEFNDIKVKKTNTIINNDLTYQVTLAGNVHNYCVYTFISKKNKIILYDLLYKEFDTYKEGLEYYYYVSNLINNHSNNYIINCSIKKLRG